MHRPIFKFYRQAILAFSFLLVSCFAVLTWPSDGFAQSGTPPQDNSQTMASPASPAPPKPAGELPEGDGKAIATEFCQDCHKLATVANARRGPDDWRDTVQLMRDRGARLPSDKIDTLVQYLAKNFAPQAAVPATGTPPATLASADSAATVGLQQPKPTVELPEGDGKAIATQFCQDCHKLTNLTKARKSPDDWKDTVQLMLDRGARLPQDKFDTLVEYLAKNFGPQTTALGAGRGSPETLPAASAPSNH